MKKCRSFRTPLNVLIIFIITTNSLIKYSDNIYQKIAFKSIRKGNLLRAVSLKSNGYVAQLATWRFKPKMATFQRTRQIFDISFEVSDANLGDKRHRYVTKSPTNFVTSQNDVIHDVIMLTSSDFLKILSIFFISKIVFLKYIKE